MAAPGFDYSQLAVALGIRIEQERKRRGLTKEELAGRTGLASRYLWRVEEGRQNLTWKTLVAIAQGLELSLSALLHGIEQLAAEPPARPERKPRGPAARRAADAGGDTAAVADD